jgi:hypothetical protein
LPAAERPAYLGEACGGDMVLRQRVEELLRATVIATRAWRCFCLPKDAIPVSPGVN